MEPAPVTNITNNAPSAPPKSGWRTSEFWLSLLAVIVGAVASSGVLPGGAPTQIAGIVSSVLGALGYSTNRSLVKRGAVVLLVLLLAAPARADGPQLRAPLPADVPAAEAAPAPPPASPAPPTLTLSGFAACSAKAAADCLANPTAPPADARAFYTSLLGSIGPALTTIGAVLWLKLDPAPLGK